MTVYLQRVVTAYESRLADAKCETAGLKAALSQLEKEHRALVNEQVCVYLRVTSSMLRGRHLHWKPHSWPRQIKIALCAAVWSRTFILDTQHHPSPAQRLMIRQGAPERVCARRAQVAKVQQMSAMRSRLERDYLDGLPSKSVLQLREHLTAKLAALREQAAALLSEPAPEQVINRSVLNPVRHPLDLSLQSIQIQDDRMSGSVPVAMVWILHEAEVWCCLQEATTVMEHRLCRSVQSAHVVLHDQGVLANAILGALVRASDESQVAEQVDPAAQHLQDVCHWRSPPASYRSW